MSKTNTDSTDPLGKRALFSPPASRSGIKEPSADGGARSLYSAADRPARGSAVVVCSRCEERTTVSVMDGLARLLPPSIWMPWRSFDRWIVCPACRRRTWCRVEWGR